MSTVRLPHHRYRDPLAAIEPKRLKRYARKHTEAGKAIAFLIACWAIVAVIAYFA